jgi:phosphoribosylformimino-5-aminoimidazole carboxamide ribotide isomerase
MELIPSIDLFDGKVVRLRKGRYEDVTVYSDEPVELARGWSGLSRRLHVVDLEGARSGSPSHPETIRALSEAYGGRIQVGGGIRSLETVESYFGLGVERVVLGTAALENPDLVRQAAAAHPGRIVVALDARGGRVATRGWLSQTEELAVNVARSFAGLGVAAVLYTDIERDGMEVGPNVEETAALARDGGLPVIASGGVGCIDHLLELARAPAKIAGVIVGRALHEGRFTLAEAVRAAESP